MLINDECSSWYDRVRDLLMSVWDRRKKILYGNGSVDEVSQNKPIPECEVNSTECMLRRLSASDLFVCFLFIYLYAVLSLVEECM